MSESGKLLLELSDIANCVSGDMHTMHLNIKGIDFDTMHADVLKKYYEEAADDYDTFAEMARRKPWNETIPSQNASATRLNWRSFEGECTRETAIKEIDEKLEAYITLMCMVFNKLNDDRACPQSQGIASVLQDRLNYWGAEWGFFNASRFGG